MKGWGAAAALAAAIFIIVAKGEVNEEGRPNRILFLFPISSKSHKNFFMGVANALADRGNEVTVISAYRPPKNRKNVEEIVVDFDIHDFMPNSFESKVSYVLNVLSKAPSLCAEVLEKKEIQGLLDREFDFAILSATLSTCLLSVIYQLKIPYAWITAASARGPLSQWIGNPPFPSFIVFPLIRARHPLTFPQRIQNTLIDTITGIAVSDYVIPRMERECRAQKLCPENMPSLYDLQYNASLMIVNSVTALETPRPMVPGIIAAGGIHCRPSQPIPEDLEEWVQGAGEDGFIYFSLGSAVRPSDMPEKYRRILVKVFGSLKQRILWKSEKVSMPDLPPNVRLAKWLPQQDILGHSSMRLFITHGGLLSTQESAYHGIPVLGLPVTSDQHANMLKVSTEGWGEVIFWEQLTEDLLLKTIQKVMLDQSMKEEAKRRSKLLRDQPIPPGEVAAYWVEYAIRHGGAPHLRSPLMTMSWYQVYNVDVWATVLFVALLVAYISFRILCGLCRLCCSRKQKTE